MEDLDRMGEIIGRFLGEAVIEAQPDQHLVAAGRQLARQHLLLGGAGQHKRGFRLDELRLQVARRLQTVGLDESRRIAGQGRSRR